MCLLCEHKDGRGLSDGKVLEHMAEKYGRSGNRFILSTAGRSTALVLKDF